MTRWPLWIALGLTLVVVIVVSIIAGRNTSTEKQTATSTPSDELTEFSAVAAAPHRAGNAIYWIGGQTAYRRPIDGTNQPELLRSIEPELYAALWSPAGDAVLVHAGDEPTQWFYAPLQSDTPLTPLSPNLLTPAWSEDGKRILYSFAGSNGPIIVAAQPNGENYQILFSTDDVVDQVWWPGEGAYAVGSQLLASGNRYVRIHVSSQRLETLASTTRTDLGVNAAPGGAQVLLDGGTNAEPKLQLATLGDGKVRDTGLTGTTVQATWQTGQRVLSYRSTTRELIAYDTGANTLTTLGTWPAEAGEPDQLVAATDTHLVFTTGTQLFRLPLTVLR